MSAVAQLPESHRSALIQLHRRLGAAGIDYQLGGSAMMVLRGIDVPVGDLDLIFPSESGEEVAAALEEWWEGFSTIDHPDFASDWYARISVSDIPVDLVGGFAIKEMGTLAFKSGGYADVAGTSIPLAPVDHWISIYERHDPAKAAQLAELVS